LEPDARLLDLRERGASLRELGDQYGVAHTTIWKYLRRLEVRP
jgi:predicted DNA binding protein